jgi:hypothetical protein
MSTAIRFGNPQDLASLSGFIYLDATTEYSKQYSGRVTKHPIDSGGTITDHFISENPRFSVSGVISSIDFSPIPSQMLLEGDGPININDTPDAVTVNNFYAGLLELLPSTILQFAEAPKFYVEGGGTTRKNYKQEVTKLLTDIMTGVYYNQARTRWENRMVPAKLYEMEGTVFANSIDNLILTGLEISEAVDDWDALTLRMEFEKVTFVTLEKVDAPKTKKKGAQPSKNKGKVTATPSTTAAKKPDAPTPTALGKFGKVFSN